MVVKKLFWIMSLLFAVAESEGQKKNSDKNTKENHLPAAEDDNTLLWKISGNGLERPSYLFGTIHMLCEQDALLSESLKKAIRSSDQVYLEVDMDNMFELLGTMRHMKMKGDTTLADLLNEADYRKVKDFFEAKSSMIPFAMLETYKPFLAVSTLLESGIECQSVAMEQVIMRQAKDDGKVIKGLETMAYQMSIFDSIPYKLQADQLVEYIDKAGKGNEDASEYDELMSAYKRQDLKKLEEITIRSDMGISSFTDLLLFNRNRNWVRKLGGLMIEKSLVIAVGAGHLPGENGVINLLRKAGYTVTPLENKVRKYAEI